MRSIRVCCGCSWREDAPRSEFDISSRGELGDTLIEVLVALLIIGIASVAIFGAYTSSILGSVQHRTMAQLDLALHNVVEQATSEIQLGQTPLFQPCATVSGTITTPSSPSGLESGNLFYGTNNLSIPLKLLPPSISITLNPVSAYAPSTQFWDSSLATWVLPQGPNTCPSGLVDPPQMFTGASEMRGVWR